jgi:hypothetical protein
MRLEDKTSDELLREFILYAYDDDTEQNRLYRSAIERALDVKLAEAQIDLNATMTRWIRVQALATAIATVMAVIAIVIALI